MNSQDNILLRRAKSQESHALTEIAIRAKQSNGYDASFMDACKDELTVTSSDLQKGEYWIAEHEAVCGFVSLFIGIESGVGELHSLFIDPEWQGRGVGKKLWFKIRERASSIGIEKIKVDADPAAVAFYESIGFKTVAKVPSGSIEGRFLPRMEILLSEC